MRVHYRIMENKKFWYDKDLREASQYFCVAASDLRHDRRLYSARFLNETG